ncbi:patatin-like phospholipase family protein [Mycolicibacterium austroafricanum]|uniref:Patatin n=2 Tax=Mycolicibacterium TaxID=1866885 RepID=A1TE63_MYCVP|nr:MULTISPECIES: patatin-like phospholipase family protein [Mycolicibacterium]ABM15463.1 Patatin [Mycolicibacterium vanbaalenii PYR-1]MDN4522130.1 patatin-like phospholipase family protein [Mycolicibacterium austroafricanum]QRZ05724.1 patatin-like phospholipase family protein [Mycolicibacterium austroafricanum]QZT67280.1 patatin-like phospholipase family protein [Mycolicibacterium austroafricanum]
MTDVNRALVLAGGGLAGIAWETGVLLGICDESPDAGQKLLAADVLLGTSAGSAVAAQVGSGVPLEELFARQLSEEHGAHEIHPGVSIDAITDLFLDAMLTQGATKAQKLAKIGCVAAETDTVPEAVRRTVIEHRLPAHEWPQRALRVTAIDIATGELVVFDAASGVGLVDAVAASCAVPGVWPPVTIGGRRFMDGGVGSTVNMSAVQDCGAAVVLVPSGANSPSPWGTGTVAEIEGFPGATLAVFADDESLAAFGANPLDPACRAPAAQAGRAQGRREARKVAEFLSV